MTSIADTDDRVVSLARGMRDLVRAEAANSEQLRTLTPAIVDEMWASGLMSAFNSAPAGGEDDTLVLELCPQVRGQFPNLRQDAQQANHSPDRSVARRPRAVVLREIFIAP